MPKAVWLGLLISLVVFFAHTRPGSVCDSSNFSLVEGLLEKGSFQTGDSHYFNRWDMAFYQGHFYSGKQPLLALLTVVVLFPVHLFVTFGAESGRLLLYYLAVVISNGSALILLFIFLRRAFSMVRSSDGRSDWVLAYIFFGSAILPFSGTYNTGLLEASLLFAAFTCLLDYRVKGNTRSPVLCGLWLGLSTLLHIFSGAIFIVWTAVYFLTCRLKDLFRFLLTAFVVLLIGMALNQWEHGNPKPFYLMTETYIYEKSPRLFDPKLSNLSEEKLSRRLDDLRLPPWQKAASIGAYRRYHENVSNSFEFAKAGFLTHDFLNLTPIFIVGFLSMILCLFDKSFRFKRETLWVVLGLVSAFAGLLVTRSDPGWSFGDRYLIPLTPLTLFFTLFYFKNENHFVFFKLFFWIAFAMMLPGIVQPWHTPNADFAKWNLLINTVILGLHLLSGLFKGVSRVVRWFHDLLARWPWVGAALVAGLLRFEFTLFAGQVFF